MKKVFKAKLVSISETTMSNISSSGEGKNAQYRLVNIDLKGEIKSARIWETNFQKGVYEVGSEYTCEATRYTKSDGAVAIDVLVLPFTNASRMTLEDFDSIDSTVVESKNILDELSSK